MVKSSKKNSRRSSGRTLNARTQKRNSDSRYRVGVLVMVPVIIALAAVVLWLIVRLFTGVLFTKNDRYNITDIDINAGRVITEDLVLEYTQIKLGDNIFSVNMSEIREVFVRKQPNVLDVDVRRILPGTIKLKLIERVPVARVRRMGVDVNGVVFRCPSEANTMPSIVKYKTSSSVIAPGTVIEGSSARAALEFLEVCDNPRVGLIVSTIDVSTDDRIDITLADGKIIKMSWDEMGSMTETSQLSMFRQILRILKLMNTERGSQYRKFDATYPGEIIGKP